MTDLDTKSREIESQAESKVQEWRKSKSNASALKAELLSLICDKTFHSTKLMRLYTEVVLRNSELEEAYASFDTYVSLQALSLVKHKKGARSLPDDLEEGTFYIFSLVLLTLEHEGPSAYPRIIKLHDQLKSILDEVPEDEVEDVTSRMSPLFARMDLTKLALAESDEQFEKEKKEIEMWFSRMSDDPSKSDPETNYARGLFLALTQGPTAAFDYVKAALKQSPGHVRALLLFVQLLSAENQLENGLSVANVYLLSKPQAKSIVDKVALIRLKKTQIALLEVLKGPETALGELPEFVEVVSTLFALEKSQHQNGAAKTMANGAVPKTARRIFSFKRRDTAESLTGDLALSSSLTPAPRQKIAEIDSRIIAFSWFWIAQQYAKAGLDAEAREALKEGKNYLTGDDDLHGIAQIQALVGQIEHKQNPQRAFRHYMQALEIVPLHVSSSIGAVLILTSDTKDIIDTNNETALTLIGILDSVCQRAPGRFIPEAWYTRGLLYEKLGVEAAARDMFWKAIELEERRGVTGYIVSADASLS